MNRTGLREFDTWKISKPSTLHHLQKCPCCECSSRSLWYRNQDMSLYRCRECSVVYQDPQPGLKSLLNQSYNQEYFDSCDQLLPAQIAALNARLDEIEKRMSDDKHHNRPLRLLDVGAGIGAFLTAAKERGWESMGIDPSPYAVRYCVDKLRLNVVEGSLDDNIPFPYEFDVINLNHVLEHFQNPVDNLNRLRTILCPGGLLVIEVPREGKLASTLLHHLSNFRFAARYPRPVFTIVHMLFFSPGSIKALIERCGFVVEDMGVEGNAVSPEHFRARFGNSPPLGRLLGRASQAFDVDVWVGLGNIVAYARSPR